MIEVLQFGLGTNPGGIETYLRKIWNHIDHKRFHFNFIDMTGEDQTPCFYDEFRASHCTFYPITPRQVSVRQNKADIQRLFMNNHFDILHFSVNTLSYILPVEEAMRAGCSVIVHSRSAGAAKRFITNTLHSINKKRISKWPITRIAVSPMAGEWLFGKSPFEVYHNGVDTKRFAFSEVNRSMVRRNMKCEDKKVIANVAAFLPAKNHIFMINTFEAYQRAYPNTVLWFIGDGPLRDQAEQQVKEKGLEESILFLGKRNDLPELYAGMDMLWFPSVYEGLGNVVLEAESEGLPCLLSDCIPQDTLIMDNAFSFSLNATTEQWIEKIHETINAQTPDRKICNRIVAEKGWSVEAEIKRLEELYSRVSGGTNESWRRNSRE